MPHDEETRECEDPRRLVFPEISEEQETNEAYERSMARDDCGRGALEDAQHLNTVEEDTPPPSDDPERRIPNSWEENQGEPDDALRRLRASNDRKFGKPVMACLRAVTEADAEKVRDYAGRLTTPASSKARRFEVDVIDTCDRIARSLVERHAQFELSDRSLMSDRDASPQTWADDAIRRAVMNRLAIERTTVVAVKCDSCGFSPCLCKPAED